jgi:putative membrane protein
MRNTALVALVVGALAWSAVAPVDRLTWLLEVAWVLVLLPVVIVLWRRFPLTPLLTVLLAAHALVLIYGGHHTYAATPLGEWARTTFELSRNPYDRLGHLVQGFVPAIAVRELLLRRTPLVRGPLLVALVASVCLAFAAFFELIEWWSALALGQGADAYLATQGDVWDTQWDMALCLLGALLAQLLLARRHDRDLEELMRGQSVGTPAGPRTVTAAWSDR